VSKSQIAVLVLLSVTVVYVVAFAYAESTKPTKILYLYIGDIFMRAAEVSPTDNETVWTDVLWGTTWKQPYRGKLQNPNMYVKTAIENVKSRVKVAPEDDFQFENGVYHYNDHYYATIKDTLTEWRTVEVNAFWKSAVDQNKNFIFAGMLLAFGWAGVGTYSLKARRRVKVLNAVTLTVAILIVAFLVEDMYRLQKEYEIVSAPLEYLHMSEEMYRMIMGKLEEIQNMINLRKTAVVLVVAATAVTLLVFNKRKLFKEKCAATALILLLVTFFQTLAVHARTSQAGDRFYAGVKLTIPQDSYLESVTGYITPRPDDISEGFVGGYIEVVSYAADCWYDWIQAGYTTDVELGTVFYIETYDEDIDHIITAPGVFFFEKYLIHIHMEIVGGVILWSAFIYDVDGNTILKRENIFLRYSLTQKCTATAESTSDCNGLEAEFSELEWKCFLDGEGYWDGTEGFTCTVIEEDDDPYFVKMKVPFYHFFASGAVGPKSLAISICSYGHGTTDPVPGYHTYDYGEVVTVWVDARARNLMVRQN